jgi:hypothetical protein
MELIKNPVNPAKSFNRVKIGEIQKINRNQRLSLSQKLGFENTDC